MIKRPRRTNASGAEAHWLPKKQIVFLQLYDDGTLLEKANEATLLSGHGAGMASKGHKIFAVQRG